MAGRRTFRAGRRTFCGETKSNETTSKTRNKWIIILKLGWKDVKWINLAQRTRKWRAVMNALKSLLVPQNVGNFLTSWGTVSFSRTRFNKTFHHIRVSTESWQLQWRCVTAGCVAERKGAVALNRSCGAQRSARFVLFVWARTDQKCDVSSCVPQHVVSLLSNIWPNCFHLTCAY